MKARRHAGSAKSDCYRPSIGHPRSTPRQASLGKQATNLVLEPGPRPRQRLRICRRLSAPLLFFLPADEQAPPTFRQGPAWIWPRPRLRRCFRRQRPSTRHGGLRSDRRELEIETLRPRPPTALRLGRIGDWRWLSEPARAAPAYSPASCPTGANLWALRSLRGAPGFLSLRGRGFRCRGSRGLRPLDSWCPIISSIAPHQAADSAFSARGVAARRHSPMPSCPTLCRLLGDVARA